MHTCRSDFLEEHPAFFIGQVSWLRGLSLHPAFPPTLTAGSGILEIGIPHHSGGTAPDSHRLPFSHRKGIPNMGDL